MVTCLDGHTRYNFHGMVQCYGQMLRIAVTLHDNFLQLKALISEAENRWVRSLSVIRAGKNLL